VDLLPLVKRNYYHPDMKGSWSLNNVSPCLVPGLRYSDLGAVQDGTQAQQAYFDLTSGDPDAAAAERLRDELLAYCRLDTSAMLAIVRNLCARENWTGALFAGGSLQSAWRIIWSIDSGRDETCL
jgi:hypothetical protein